MNMTDTTLIARTTVQDGEAPAEASLMPLGPNAVFADDSNIQAAENLRAAQMAARERAEARSTISIDDGVQRITHNSDGSIATQQLGVVRGDSAPVPTGSILDSARSTSGQPLTASQVTGDSVITYQGMEMQVRVAESLGFVRKGAEGYVDPNAGTVIPPVTVPSVEANSVSDQPAEPSPADRASAQDAAAEAAIRTDGALTGDYFEAALAMYADPDAPALDASDPRLAAALGYKGSATEGALAAVQQSHIDAAAEVVVEQGVTDMAAFVEWAQAQSGWREAFTKAVLERNPSAWAPLAREFSRMSLQAHSDADIMAADFGPGVNVLRGPDGKAWLDIDGEKMPWQAAHRRGIIKLSDT